MSNRRSQGIATWLIMVPLVVVPLIAVFGVPKMSPIATQTADGADGEELPQFEPGDEAPLADIPPFPDGAVEESPQPHAAPPTREWSDPFDHPDLLNPGSRQDPSPGSTAPPNSGTADPFSSPNGPSPQTPPDELWSQPPAESGESDPRFKGYSRHPSSPNRPENRPESQFEPEHARTWRQAVARLNELGVQKFQLSQTEEPYVFQFVCDLTRPDNPSVTHRFKAEAGEPLKAVENVIQQVESWSAQLAPR